MPVTLKSSGGGSVTMDVPSTASTYTLTLPAVTGTVLQTGTTVTVAQGGTGLATLTANNVILGNGTGTPNFVAPGTNGNVLTSNGTTWTSTALPAAGGVTSLTAGGGITVSASTGAVTVSQDIYTGSTSTNTSFPIGTVLPVQRTGTAVNGTTTTVYVQNTSPTGYDNAAGGGKTALSGTWRARGELSGSGCNEFRFLYQRTA